MTSSTPRVVITGLGLVSPIGSDLETVWSNLSSGTSGVSTIEGMPTDALPVHCGGEAKDFTGKIDDYGPLEKKRQRAIKKNMKVMCREIEMGVAASQKALSHSGLGEERDPARCGCLFGCDYILTRPEEYMDGLRKCMEEREGPFEINDWPINGLSQVNPLWLLKYLPNMPNSHVSIYNDFRGPNNSITLREASMNLSVAEATSIIQRGAADVMLVGATGSKIHPLRSMQAWLTEQVAPQRDNPATMQRPFDSDAQGVVIGEGAGAVMLESYEHASARGAKIWGEVIGHGSSMVGPRDGRDNLQIAVSNALQACIQSAGEQMPQTWHAHAQGTGTLEADKSESLAFGEVLSNHPDVAVTSAKSYSGSLGAGSAAVELISSLLALEHQQLFPILNLDQPCEHVSWTPASAGSSAGDGFLHSSFTMQGQAASLMVRRV